jgi:cyclophilin family peptidyl-prolyl cis-trans isomerase
MKRIILLLLFTGLFAITSCGDSEKTAVIETSFGELKIKLYNETPQHRDNFVKLIKDGFYKDLLFHRVIKGFMVQGGDPDSKNAAPETLLGKGDLGYTIPAEINPKFIHRRGILAAARQGDQANPERRSSACQFYILQGKVFRPGELDTLEMKMQESKKMELFQERLNAVKPELNKLGAEGKQDEMMARFNALKEEVSAEADKLPPFKFSEEQRKAYTTVGGYPSLDNNYTIFGEVTDGLDVLDKIADQETDGRNRPKTDIRFTIEMTD